MQHNMIKINNKPHNNPIKIYEYFNITNPTYYLNNIENISTKQGKWSLGVLVDDLEKNIKINENFIEFKDKILNNIRQMDICYDKNNVKKTEQLHNEGMGFFNKYIEKEIISLIDDNDKIFYTNIKKETVNLLNIILMFTKKINSVENDNPKLNFIIKKNMYKLNVNKNILKKYYKQNKNEEDLIIANITNIFEINNVLDFIKNNNKIYLNVKLPSKIIIKDDRHRYYCIYNKNIILHNIILELLLIININPNNNNIRSCNYFYVSDTKYIYLFDLFVINGNILLLKNNYKLIIKIKITYLIYDFKKRKKYTCYSDDNFN